MTMDPLSILVATTAIISWQLMDSPQKAKWMLIPHACHAHGEWHRVVSHAFVHADWMHLAFNMFVLYEFGQTVLLDLAPLGWMGFPAMYFAGIVAGALPALRKHRFNPAYRSLGASGAVSAVLLAFICLHPTRTLLLFFVIPVPAILAGVLFFWYESQMQRRGGSYVAHDAHLGGALVGVAWVFASMPESLWRSVTALQELIQ